MRIAIFDPHVVPTNPIGGCHRIILERLCDDHAFTVFAVEFDNPRPDRIIWVRVPAPKRPLALLFVVYHVTAPLCYLLHRLRRRVRFDLVQVVESNLSFGDVCYAQFCHRRFLRQAGPQARSRNPRVLLRRLDHRLRALAEPRIFRCAHDVVVPSAGLAEELADEYPVTAGKVTVVHNPVSLAHMAPPADFDRDAVRARLELGPDDIALVFVALGHFERKGLPLLLEAVAELRDRRLKLVVVGGQPDLVNAYAKRVTDRGLSEVVSFVGMQPDVRPHLWAADAFALPSTYETFSFATWEAAAAGLPIVVTEHHGTRGVVVDGENGFVVDGTLLGMIEGLRLLASLSPQARHEMGERAREISRRFGVDGFLEGWSQVYARLA